HIPIGRDAGKGTVHIFARQVLIWDAAVGRRSREGICFPFSAGLFPLRISRTAVRLRQWCRRSTSSARLILPHSIRKRNNAFVIWRSPDEEFWRTHHWLPLCRQS